MTDAKAAEEDDLSGSLAEPSSSNSYTVVDNPDFTEYRPLDEHEIRLLRVKQQGILDLDFHYTLVETAPQYLAVSYAWGPAILFDAILVAGRPFYLRRNLYDFCAEWIVKFEENTYIWIDAICIDQKNFQERSSQIILMNSIFRSASNVFCWLGAATEDTAAGFERMKTIADTFAPLLVEGDPVEVIPKCAQEHELLRWNSCDGDSIKAWRGIRDFQQREYFKRAWIIQETVPGNAERYILCGSSHLSWEGLTLLNYIISVQFFPLLTEDPSSIENMGSGTLLGIPSIAQRGDIRDMLELLLTVSSFHCQDPRDKIYAIRGLVNVISSSDLVPDYQKRLSAVYIDVVEFLVTHSEQGHKLDFLGHVYKCPTASGAGKDRLDLPSWVPDWRYKIQSQPFPSTRIYHPSLDLQTTCFIQSESLLIKGLSLDTIAWTSSICSSRMLQEIDLDSDWYACEPQNQDILPGQTTDILGRTVVADAFWAPSIARGSIMDWNFARRVRYRPKSEYEKRHYNDMARAAMSFRQTCAGRRLIITAKGHLGIAPGASQEGDEICLFFGGQTLYVLRPAENDQHNFVGQCYLDGLMDGEALSSVDEPEQIARLFCLI